MRWMCMTLLLMFSFAVAAGEMWRWVDERGVVHYSDRPHPGAERVDIGPAQTFQAPRPATPRPAPPAERESPREPPTSYSRLTIVSPQEGENLWNIGGQLSVQLNIEPGLSANHELQVYLDGQRVADGPQGTQFTLEEVFRGERQLRVAIIDDAGRELASSATVTFYVHQASLLNPNRPRATPGSGGG